MVQEAPLTHGLCLICFAEDNVLRFAKVTWTVGRLIHIGSPLWIMNKVCPRVLYLVHVVPTSHKWPSRKCPQCKVSHVYWY
jgi:hypothetical protein